MRHWSVAFTVGALLVWPAAAAAATFTRIADTTDGLAFVVRMPAVDANGTVAFHAVTAAGEAVLTGRGGALHAAPVPESRVEAFGPPVIDTAGVVALHATLGDGTEAVVRGGAIVARSGDAFTAFGGLIAAAGTGLAVHATRPDGREAIALVSGAAPPVTLASTGETMIHLGLPDANASARVAFRAVLTGGEGVFVAGPDLPAAPVARSGDRFATFGDLPVLNDAGAVAFVASMAAGGAAVMRAQLGEEPIAVATTGDGTFTRFDVVAINEAGTVALLAALGRGGRAIWIAGRSLHPVIAVGDVLDGSTVTALDLGRAGLGAGGHVAFYAELADGRRGIWRADAPNLRVTSVVLPANAGAGTAFSLTDTTKNLGPGPVPATRTRFFLSSDNVLDPSDVEIGSRLVSPLAAGTDETVTTTVTLPALAAIGTHSVIALADAGDEVAESSEQDNTKSAALKLGPDLRIANVTAPAAAGAGEAITVGATTENQGAAAATGSVTRVYFSTDAALDGADLPLGARAVPGLAPGATDSDSIAVTVPATAPEGPGYLIVRADADDGVPEIAEGNNLRARPIAVGPPVGSPDLVVASLTARPTLAGIVVSEVTRNEGGGPAPASTTVYLLSRTAEAGPDAVPIFRRPVRALAAGQSSGDAIGLALPDGTEGAWFVIARADADAVVAETTRANNVRAASFTIVPDLAPRRVSVSTREVAAGDRVMVIDAVRNSGHATAPPSVTRLYLAPDGEHGRRDVLLASRAVPALCPRSADSALTEVVIPLGTAPGRYRIVTVADGEGDVTERREGNNAYTSRAITVR